MRGRPLRVLTPHEIQAFDRDGAVLLKAILPPEWVALARDGLDAAIAEPDELSADVGVRVDQFPAARSTGLRGIVEDSPIAEIVGQALQSPVRFYMDQLFYKPAGPITPTPWHQDTSYYNVDGSDLIRAWLSPDSVPRNASLEVVRGSHRWNVTYRPLAGRDPQTDPQGQVMLENAVVGERMIGVEAYDQWSYFTGLRDPSLPLVPDIEAHRDSYDILGWDYEPGDVILFHGHILHSARGGVTAATPRRTHASLWAGQDVCYLHRVGQIIPDPVGLYAHEPKTGQPLSDFPDVFPLAWSPDASRRTG